MLMAAIASQPSNSARSVETAYRFRSRWQPPHRMHHSCGHLDRGMHDHPAIVFGEGAMQRTRGPEPKVDGTLVPMEAIDDRATLDVHRIH